MILSAPPETELLPGHFGPYGGTFVPETLVGALEQLDAAYQEAKADPAFGKQLDDLLRDFVGRPSRLTFAKRLTEHLGGAKIYLKREDLNHTGAHKINNTLGQALLAIRMGKQRVIAETGAGQHGVATATAAALLGLSCDVYMGAEDVRRQSLNVFRMRLMGASVIEVNSGSRTLKDATNEAMRDWMGSVAGTHYILGSVVGPHPFPTIVRDFQRVIGDETIEQTLEIEGRLPDAVVACVGGGSNASGIFYPFASDERMAAVRLIGVEAGGRGKGAGQHAAPLAYGSPGVLHGSLSLRFAGRGRPNRRRPQLLGRPGLPRRRPGARLLEGHRPRRVRRGRRRRGAGGVPAVGGIGGHPPRAGDGPRLRARRRPRTDDGEGSNHRGEPVGARGQRLPGSGEVD